MNSSQVINSRKHLSADSLFSIVYSGFEEIKDHRTGSIEISLSDALMSAFAMFSLKYPSLLAFENRQKDENLNSIYGMENIPSDTQMRTILDEVDPREIQVIFKAVFRQIQRGRVLEKMVFIYGCYLLSIDGTGYFSSKKIHCSSCLEKVNSKTGEITYSHHMLGAAIVHPDRKEVIPLAPEPIVKQDGETKNDCERNACKRFLKQLRKDHPRLPLIVTEDGLSSNAPHIRDLKAYSLHFILGVKKGDHAFLFEYVETAYNKGLCIEFEIEKEDVIHHFRYINQVPLNASNQDVLVNFLEYWETKKKTNKVQHFSWITDFTITNKNAFQLMRGGRARWKIENETFNTLKNQGYHFEHNFGHGKKYLSVVFAIIMMLAFLVDQTQQLACALFRALLNKERTRKAMWEHIRNLFFTLPFDSMGDIYRALLYGYKVENLIILQDP